jgi:hypothetical protein
MNLETLKFTDESHGEVDGKKFEFVENGKCTTCIFDMNDMCIRLTGDIFKCVQDNRIDKKIGNFKFTQTMNELFPPVPKTKLRTHKGRWANEVQFLRDENKRLKNALELEQRKQPGFKEIRKATELVDFFRKQLSDQFNTICQLNEILKNLKK